MSLIDLGGDPWLREHEACDELCRDIAAQLSKRDSEIPSSVAYRQLSSSICLRMRQLTTEVQQLRSKLTVISNNHSLTPLEKERRTRLVERIESSTRQLQQHFNTRDEGNASRSHLMPSTARSNRAFVDMGTTGWGNDPEEAFDVNRAQKMTQAVIEEQDAGLNELAKIIARQKNIARAIGDEVDVQNEILDDLSETIDRTSVGLINETQQVRTISRKDSTCGYWVVIILLFIAILVVSLV